LPSGTGGVWGDGASPTGTDGGVVVVEVVGGLCADNLRPAITLTPRDRTRPRSPTGAGPSVHPRLGAHADFRHPAARTDFKT